MSGSIISNINPAWPVFGNPMTETVRENFLNAKLEIESLKAAILGAVNVVSPIAGDGTAGNPLHLQLPLTVAQGGTGSATLDGSPFLQLVGGIMLGALVLAHDAHAPMQAVTYQQFLAALDDGVY
jgi:hypothetical protein